MCTDTFAKDNIYDLNKSKAGLLCGPAFNSRIIKHRGIEWIISMAAAGQWRHAKEAERRPREILFQTVWERQFPTASMRMRLGSDEFRLTAVSTDLTRLKSNLILAGEFMPSCIRTGATVHCYYHAGVHSSFSAESFSLWRLVSTKLAARGYNFIGGAFRLHRSLFCSTGHYIRIHRRLHCRPHL